ncbi:MAG TPA: DUF3667 domain-containing protein [Puia sp.]|uniref:DUF3667 domain-containing protein n=1 Tax=Puia sp. TaxID=2045100 RepID=UPI002BB33031|nr:DUF3667 domain-containing protein [Puia sp.]HVU98453.1 DUF3667 domain-containing protein [Puia sp.]
MSHLHERKEKNCLNCQTEVIGRYCHKCGQENLEPKETVWHLVQHFFNDITHFDGKFFDTVKYLIKKPGFLSLEYMRGRRMSYLNPIRMYVFTSAIFFIILYSITKPEDMAKGLRQDKTEKNAPSTKKLADLIADTARYHKSSIVSEDEDDRQDYHDKWEHRLIEIAAIQKAFGDTTKQTFTKRALDSILFKAYSDSLQVDTAGEVKADLAKTRRFQRAVRNYALDRTDGDDGDNFNFMGSDITYRTIEQYDSAEHALPDSLRDGWLKHFITRRGIVIRQEWHEDKARFVEHLMENILHSFPKILWISLPIFALILNILYFRHKKTFFYVNHGIFTIHVYCATFIQLFLILMLYLIGRASASGWVHLITGLATFAICLWTLIYLYKAMRGFYGQRRAKTFLKYFIVMGLMFWINIILLTVFLLISVFSV